MRKDKDFKARYVIFNRSNGGSYDLGKPLIINYDYVVRFCEAKLPYEIARSPELQDRKIYSVWTAIDKGGEPLLVTSLRLDEIMQSYAHTDNY